MNRAERLGSDRLLPLIVMVSLPAIVGNMTNAVYNMVDRLFVGNYVGTVALGAIGLIFPLNNITAAVTVMLSVGGGASISLALGKRAYKEANTIMTNLLVQALIMALTIACVYSLAAPQLVAICGADPGTDLYEMALVYLRIVAIGQVFQIMNLAVAAVIRAEGNTAYAMVVAALGAIVNVGLDALFIRVFHMGIEGAAIATVISQFVGVCIGLYYFLSHKSILKWAGLKVCRIERMYRTLVLGSAPALLQGLSFITNMIINNVLMTYGMIEMGDNGGTLALSAVSVMITVETLAIMGILGVNNGISTIIGYNYGQGNYDRVRKTALIGQGIAFAISFLLWWVMMFKPEFLFSAFSDGDAELIAYGTSAIRKAKVFIVFLGFQTLASMYYSAIGNPKIAACISLSRNGLFLIPALMILPRYLGLDGVLYSTAVSDLLSMIVVSRIYFKGIGRLKTKEKESLQLVSE